MKKRARIERRVDERAAKKLVRDKQRLAGLSPGGSAERPIDVTSAAVIAVRARSIPCPLCAGSLQLDEETAETFDGHRRRAAHMVCSRCGVKRVLWFTIGSPLGN